jgi:2-(1,2-epoxy-1,2-dihydrophenyl)acetyl-CoA isomerase
VEVASEPDAEQSRCIGMTTVTAAAARVIAETGTVVVCSVWRVHRMRLFGQTRGESSAQHGVASSVGAVRTLKLTPMYAGLLEQLNAIAADSAVRCVVLTGGARAFSGRLEAGQPHEAQHESGDTRAAGDAMNTADLLPIELMERLSSMPVPLIAAVSGKVSGVGMSIALSCDLVIAARSATFTQPFGRAGVRSGAGTAWLLPRLIGRARALGWTLLGETLTAEDAVNIGLIWACYPGKVLEIVVGSIAQRVAAIPTDTAVATRKAMDAALTLDLRDALSAEARMQSEISLSCGRP